MMSMASGSEVGYLWMAEKSLNKLRAEDSSAHEWYRFVLSFPPHFIRDYLQKFGVREEQRVLDPFCGTGTTLVECKKLGIEGVGIEAHPMTHFASQIKLDWTPDADGLLAHAQEIAVSARETLGQVGIDDDHPYGPDTFFAPPADDLRTLPEESLKLLLKNSISPLPLHKALVLLEEIERRGNEGYREHERLALARALPAMIGNLRFGPEVGVRPPKPDAPVISSWMSCVQTIVNDLRTLQELDDVPSQVHNADARRVLAVLEPNSVDAVLTSPPYQNEKDYTRTTRLETVLLGFLKNRTDLRDLKRALVRSNTRGVYQGDSDDQWVAMFPEIERLADAIEARRMELNKTSGFERLYGKVTRLYFGGMYQHLSDLRTALRPGARLAYVVGDQASYLRVMIRTGQLLADIAESLGYQVDGIDLFRTRRATATGEQLREEVIVLTWPGEQGL